MEWLVINVIYLRATGLYVLILHAASLKMIAEVYSEVPVQVGDILYPVRDAIYLINKNESQCLKVISASEFSATQWRFLKRLSVCEAATMIQIVQYG
jgi:Polymyxin resistance protein PmrD.